MRLGLSLLLTLMLGIQLLPSRAVAASELSATADIPIWIELDKPQVVTVVIEDAEGVRVRNLVSELSLPAGRNRLSWDGYDDGVRDVPFVQRHDQVSSGALTRKRVSPGKYRARGITHDGIKLIYEFTAYSGGNPPWPTRDQTGAWLADHSAPLGAVFIPAGSGSPFGEGRDQVLLTSLIAEAGAPLVWADLDGKTLRRRHLWGWSGANAATRDAGAKADKNYYAYLVIANDKRITVRGLKTNGEGAELVSFSPAKPGIAEPRHEGHSIAVRDGLAVINAPTDELLVFIDLAARKVLGTTPMPKPRGLAFDDAGRLLVISDGKVLRFNLSRAAGDPSAAPALEQKQELITSGLDQPMSMAINPAGTELYVADWGQSNRVHVFDRDGKALRVIGKPGNGRQLGLYDELQMQMPLGLAVDSRDQLWVVEATHLPKRVSIWNAQTGAFVRAHYGPPRYGGGGTIDPTDKTRMFYKDYLGLMEFTLDWEKGTARPRAVLVRPGNNRGTLAEAYGIEYSPEGPSRWGFVGDRPVHVNGRTYIVGDRVVWMVGDDHIAWPVGFVGGTAFAWPPSINENFDRALKSAGLKRAGNLLVTWSDRNLNHKIDSDEFRIRRLDKEWVDDEGKPQRVSGFVQEHYHDDLSMTANWALHVPAPTFDEAGVPIWDLEKAEFLLPPMPMFRYAESDPYWGTGVWPLSDGWIVSRGGWAGWKDGKAMWTYSVLGADPAPKTGGEVVHPRGMLAPPVKAAVGEAGYWYGVNGEKGNMFLMTADGLYLQTLGGDMRNTPLLRFPTAERGMLIDAPGQHVSFEDEHYNPSITQTDDGKIYLVAGKEHSSIFRVDGFDTIRRRDFSQISLDDALIAQLPEHYKVPAARATGGQLKVEVGGEEPALDGKTTEYEVWASLGSGGQKAAVRATATHLYAAWQTNEPEPLKNAGGDWRYLFKRGGAVDLMIRTADGDARRSTEPVEGDLRLLITTVQGATKAVLYRPVAPGRPEQERVLFDSPIGQASFDSVTDVSDQVGLAQHEGNIEVRVPLELIGINPEIGKDIVADIGLLRGDGVQTLQRIYWNNPDTLIVSDIPSEARLKPRNWGTWKFVPPIEPLPPISPIAPPADVKPGLRYSIFKGKWQNLPDFSTLTPTTSGVTPVPQLIETFKEPNEFGIEFVGMINIPADGDWTLTTNSNDGSRLWLNGALVVDSEGVHDSIDESRTVALKAGTYDLRIGYFQLSTGKKLEVRWSGPGVPDQPVPASAFSHRPANAGDQ